MGDGAGDGTENDGTAHCPEVPCGSTELCYEGRCVTDQGPCSSDDDCQDDSFCPTPPGRCVPYGPPGRTHDPSCKNQGFNAAQLSQPAVKCSWTSAGSYSAPMVADLDGDKKPEIIFMTLAGELVVLDGATCTERFSVPGAFHYCAQPALGDLVGDSKLEIVSIGSDNVIKVYDHTGKLLLTAPEAAKVGLGQNPCGGPALANLDGLGGPEIIYAGMALAVQGGALKVLYNLAVPEGYAGMLTTVADVDLDGKPEVLTGTRILDGMTGADKTPAAVTWPAGYVAIGQIDRSTPEPEIISVTSDSGPATLRVYHPISGAVVFGPYTFGAKWGGPPTVADFDGDGEAEIAVAGVQHYTLFDTECAATPLPAHCAAPGIRWQKPSSEFSSGITGSSVFDFNGDGKAEVVYRDECWLRIYDGSSGKVLFGHPLTSGTGTELPVIADVDGDGHADIVVASTDYNASCTAEPELGQPHTGVTQGIFVLQDPQNRWMPSRAIWNQHTYHITNVEEDGRIPLLEKNNWDSWNNFRQNTQGTLDPVPATDLTGGKHVGIDPSSDCVTTWILSAKLCNRGAADAPAGINGTFFRGDPRASGTLICTAKTSNSLPPGSCEVVKCTFENPPKDAIDLWFRADDDGGQIECNEQNNLLHLPQISCPGISID